MKDRVRPSALDSGWRSRQLLALLLFGILLVTISGLLQLTTVTRLAAESAQSECELISQTVYLRIAQLVSERPEDPGAALRDDEGLSLLLQAATSHASAIAYVAVCDSTGIAMTHTNPEEIGEPVAAKPPFQPNTGLLDSFARITSLGQGAFDYGMDKQLLLGGRPFVTIRVGVADTFIRDAVARAFRSTLVAGLLQIGLALVFGIALARVAAGRLRRLEEGIGAIREGRFENRIPEAGLDEFSRLAREMNLLGEAIQKERASRGDGARQIRRAVELLSDAVLTLGPSGEVVLVNEPAAVILDVPVDAMRGKRLEDVLPEGHPVRVLIDRLRAGQQRSLLVPLPRGGYVAVGHRLAGEGDGGGYFIEFKREAQQEELHSLVDRSRVNSRLGQMAAGVAHEIRGPLQKINIELDQLRRANEQSPEEVRSHVRAALDNVQAMQRAISGFLKVARLSRPNLESVEVDRLLAEIHEAGQAEANFAGCDLELSNDGDESPVMQIDRQVIRQAIENLMRNALQAAPSRDQVVRLESRRVDGEVWITVRDTGPGIPPEHLARVCDLYFTTKESGTGVGLALVRQAVELHGGDVEIESIVGEGTAVTMRLPIRADSAEEDLG